MMTFAFAMGARKRSEEGDEESEQARAGISIMKPRWAQTGIKYDTDKNIFSPLALFSSLCFEVSPSFSYCSLFCCLLSVVFRITVRLYFVCSASLLYPALPVLFCCVSLSLSFTFCGLRIRIIPACTIHVRHGTQARMHTHTHRLKQSHRYPADLSVLGEVFESVFWDTSIVRFNTYLFLF